MEIAIKKKKQRTNTSKELEEINNDNLHGKLRKVQTFLKQYGKNQLFDSQKRIFYILGAPIIFSPAVTKGISILSLILFCIM